MMYGFPDLPLMEGIVGFSALGVTLIGLTWLEKMGVITVSERTINGVLVVGSIIGLCYTVFKLKDIVGI